MNKKITLILTFLSVFFFIENYGQSYVNDFEDNNLEPYGNITPCADYIAPCDCGIGSSVYTVSDNTRIGNYACEFRLLPCHEKSDITFTYASQNQDNWVGFSCYFPVGQSDFSATLWQFHDTNGGNQCSGVQNIGPVRFGVSSSGIYLHMRTKRPGQNCNENTRVDVTNYSLSDMLGTWTDFVVNCKPSTSSDGYYKIWMRPAGGTWVQVVDYSGVSFSYDGNGPAFRFGPYTGNPRGSGSTWYVGLDEVKFGVDAGFEAVAPDGDSPLPTKTINVGGDSYTYQVVAAEDFDGQSGNDWTANWTLDGGETSDNQANITGDKLVLSDSDGPNRVTFWYNNKMPERLLVKYTARATTGGDINHWSHMTESDGSSPVGNRNGYYADYYQELDGYIATFTQAHSRLRYTPVTTTEWNAGVNLLWEDLGLEANTGTTYEIVYVVDGSHVREYINGTLRHTTNSAPARDAGWFALRTLNCVLEIDDIEFGNLDINGTTCNEPSGLSTSNITETSATLSWGNDASANSYDIQYRPVGGSWSSNINTSSNNYDLTGLSTCTNYEWQVRTNCSSGSSTYTQSSFSTAGCTFIIYEAEDATDISNAQVRTHQPGYSGTGFIDYNNVANGYFELNIFVANPGLHEFSIRYANGTSPHDPRTCLFSIDGTDIHSGYDFPNTGGWDVWALTEVVATANLSAGSHTLRLTAIDAQGGPNVDYIRMNVPIGDTYSLTVNNGSGDGNYSEGANVSISADTPPAGQQFAVWTGDISYLADASSANTTVTMPAQDITVSATYEALPTYTLTITNGSGSGDYFEGANVDISAEAPPSGQQFAGWTGDTEYVDNPSNANTIVTMPALNISLTATYSAIPTYTLTVNNGSGGGIYQEGELVSILADAPQAGEEFAEWTGDIAYLADAYSASTTVTMPASSIAVTASYQPENTCIDGGLLSNNGYEDGLTGWTALSCTNVLETSIVACGDQAAKATGRNSANDGIYQLITDDVITNGNGEYYIEVMMRTVSGTSNAKVDICYRDATTHWAPKLTGEINSTSWTKISGTTTVNYSGSLSWARLQVRTNSGTGDILVDEVKLTKVGAEPTYTLTVNNGSGDGSYEEGTVVSVVADAPAAGMQFAGWEGPVANASNSSTTVTMPASTITVTATYEAVPTYELTVVNGSGSGMYEESTEVPIVADAPATGMQFAGWEGPVANASSPSTTVTMPATAVTVSATYETVPTYELTVENGSGSGVYEEGTVVSIVADAPATGMQFAGWEGPVADANNSSTTVTMPTSTVTVTATYEVIPTYELTVVNGSGSGMYEEGTVVSVVADAPAVGMEFAGWEGNVADATNPSTTVTMPAAAVTVTATYQPENTCIDGGLLSNNGFEDGLAGWTALSCTNVLETSIVACGGQAAKATGRNSDNDGIYQLITDDVVANGNGEYYIEVMMRTVSGTSDAKVDICYRDNTNHWAPKLTGAINSTSWTKISGTTTVNYSGSLSWARLQVRTNSGTGDILVDEVKLTKVGAEKSPSSLSLDKINVYPVPCSVCTINAGEEWIGATIQVTDLIGKLIYSGEIYEANQTIELTGSHSGLAIIKIEKDGKYMMSKIVVE